MKITAKNPLVDELEFTYLSIAPQAVATSLTVRNNNGFVNGGKILIGKMGFEKTEIATVAGAVTAGTALTTSALVFPHVVDDPVYVLKYDQMKFYRSTTGSGGSYSLIATVAIDVDNENLETIYDDTNGLSSYYYKVSYYDSVNSIESTLSDPIAGSGYDRNMVGRLINEFFEEVGDTNQQIMTVSEALGIMNEVNDDLLTQSRRPYRWLKASTLLDTVAGNNRISLPSSVYKVDRIAYTRDDGIDNRTDNYRIISIEEMEYEAFDNNAEDSDDLIYLAIDDASNEIVMYPTPLTSQNDVVKVWYYSYPTEFTAMNQEFQTPSSRVYKLYLLGKYYRKRAVKESSYISISDRYFNDYTSELVKMQRANRIDVGTKQGMKPDTRHSRGLRRF